MGRAVEGRAGGEWPRRPIKKECGGARGGYKVGEERRRERERERVEGFPSSPLSPPPLHPLNPSSILPVTMLAVARAKSDADNWTWRQRAKSDADNSITPPRARLASTLIGQMERGERVGNTGTRGAAARAPARRHAPIERRLRPLDWRLARPRASHGRLPKVRVVAITLIGQVGALCVWRWADPSAFAPQSDPRARIAATA